MAFSRPTLAELIDRTKTDFEDRLTGGGSLLRRAVVRVLARVYAGALHLLYGFLNWIYLQVMPDTAEGAQLERWANIWGVSRKPADFAAGDTLTFTGTNGSIIPIDTVLQRSDGAQYKTDVQVTIASGTGVTGVTAVEPGSDGNADAGTVLTLLEPIAGVTSEATVGVGGITDGANEETDASLLERLLARIQLPPEGGSDNDYVQWARSIAGVTRAWCYPLYYGDGTVGVTFVLDDNVGSIIPGAPKVAEVQAYIDSVRPVTADVTVFAPTADTTNFTVTLDPDTADARAAVTAELTDLLRRETEPGAPLLLSHIRQAVQIGAGDGDSLVTVPAADVSPAAGHIPVMGTVTFL